MLIVILRLMEYYAFSAGGTSALITVFIASIESMSNSIPADWQVVNV